MGGYRRVSPLSRCPPFLLAPLDFEPAPFSPNLGDANCPSEVCFVFARLCLTAPESARHSWMLDVAKKMLSCRAGAGVRDDDTAAQLWRQLEQSDSDSNGHSDNPDSGAGLRAVPLKRGCVHTGNYGRDSSEHDGLPVLGPRRIQLQRHQHLPGHLGVSDLVR